MSALVRDGLPAMTLLGGQALHAYFRRGTTLCGLSTRRMVTVPLGYLFPMDSPDTDDAMFGDVPILRRCKRCQANPRGTVHVAS